MPLLGGSRRLWGGGLLVPLPSLWPALPWLGHDGSETFRTDRGSERVAQAWLPHLQVGGVGGWGRQGGERGDSPLGRHSPVGTPAQSSAEVSTGSLCPKGLRATPEQQLVGG